MLNLIDAPSDTPLRIIDIHGGHGVRRRFFALGFHKNDLIELESKSIMRGPVLVRNRSNGTSLAIGRGIAQKIWVEIVGQKK